MQAVSHLAATESPLPPTPAAASSTTHPIADYDCIPDIEDAFREAPDDANLPDLEDYFTTGPVSWGPATVPDSFSGFKLVVLPSPSGIPVGSPVGSLVGSLVGIPVGSPSGIPVGSPAASAVGSSVGSPVGSSVLQASLLQPSAPDRGPGVDDGWEVVALIDVVGTPRACLNGAAVGTAGLHGGWQVRGSQTSSLVGVSVPAAVQGFDAGVEASMASWLPQRAPRAPLAPLVDCAEPSSSHSVHTQTSSSAVISSCTLTKVQQPSSLAAVESSGESQPDWVELSLDDQHEHFGPNSNVGSKAQQSIGSGISEGSGDQHEQSGPSSGVDRKTPHCVGSGIPEDLRDASNSSPRILARLDGGQRPRWDVLEGWSAQMSTKGRQLTHQLSDKGKQLVEQAQTSVATAVAEVRQAQAGQVAWRGSVALQQASRQLQPHVSAGASAVMQDMHVMTAGVKDATAELAQKAKTWWQRHSPSS